MLKKTLSLVFFVILIVSCKDDKQEEIQLKESKKKEQIFSEVNAHWKFNAAPINAVSQQLTATWAPWRDLLRELSQKPQISIEAFQKKSEVLSAKAAELPSQLPNPYAKPEVHSRIAVLTARINALNLFLHLDDIPSKKVNAEVDAINASLISLQMQFDEIVRKSKIPTEQGESDMIRMLDTARAVPTGGVFPTSAPATSAPNRTSKHPIPMRRSRLPRALERQKQLQQR